MTAVPAHRDIETVEAALEALEAALPAFLAEARSVLGGELHYQAMLYHALRTAGGVPVRQLGMNVKQLSRDPVSALFREKAASRHVDYAGVAEPIPDAVIFGPGVGGDWRRRRREVTLREMLVAVELKVSERRDSRLGAAEVLRDIEKLDAHREEVAALGGAWLRW